MPIQNSDQLTPREYEQYNQQKEMFELQSQHALRMQEGELRVKTLEAKWTSLFRLPVLLIKLPVLVILAVAFCIAVVRKHELSESFWNYMR